MLAKPGLNDAYDSEGVRFSMFRSLADAVPRTVTLAFVSAAGNGVAAVCRVEPERYAESFDAARDHFKAVYGLEADRSCSDVFRLRFLSHDPGAAGTPSARVIKVCPVPLAPKTEKPGLLCASAPTLPKERREEILSALERVSPDDRQTRQTHAAAFEPESRKGLVISEPRFPTITWTNRVQAWRKS